MADPTHTAIDVALLLPDSLGDVLTTLNQILQAPPDGFYFDFTHLPHLTLVQQFVRRHDLKAIADVVDDVIRKQAPLALTTTHLSRAQVSSTIGVELTLELVTLHRRLMERLEPFRDRIDSDDPHDAFATNHSGPRPADIEWVGMFRERSALQRFNPHITIGVGALTRSVAPTPFVATRLAICHLGRFCTCRRVLRAWTLTASER